MNIEAGINSKKTLRRVIGATIVGLCAIVCSLLSASPAAACCTNTLCDWCVSGTSKCISCLTPIGVQKLPVCNSFGCNCNQPCNCLKPASITTCKWVPCCGSAEAAREGAIQRFREIDRDHNEEISLDEALAWSLADGKDRFAGRLDRDAFAEPLRAFEAAGKTDAAVKALFRAAFDKADTNRDGKISPGELDPSLADGGGKSASFPPLSTTEATALSCQLERAKR